MISHGLLAKLHPFVIASDRLLRFAACRYQLDGSYVKSTISPSTRLLVIGLTFLEELCINLHEQLDGVVDHAVYCPTRGISQCVLHLEDLLWLTDSNVTLSFGKAMGIRLGG